jgi:hypothetical protein
MLRLLSVLVLVLTFGVGNVWGAENDTHQLTTASEMGTSTTSTLLNSNASIPECRIEVNYPIKQLVLNYRSNNANGKVNVAVSVGDSDWGNQNIKSNTSDQLVFSNNGESVSGTIVITFTNNSGSGTGKGTFYKNSITLTEGAPAPTYDVHWSINGVVVEDEELNGKPSVPEDVAEVAADVTCSGKVFVGWTTNENYTHATTAPTDLFTEQAKTAISGETTYYAVYADAEEGEEDDVEYSFLTSDDASTSTTAGWSITNPTTSYAATYGATWLRNSNASLPIFTFTPTSDVSKIVIKVRQSNTTGSNTVACTVGGAAVGTTQNMSGTSQYNMPFTPTKASKGQIIITCTNTSGSSGSGRGSFYVASITLTQKSVTYTNYVTTCCQTLGSINGSFFWTTHFCPAWPAKHRS